MGESPRVHLLIPTHTTRHLATCLAGVAWQESVPDTVVVTCDTDDPAISGLLDEWWPRIAGSLKRRSMSVPKLLHTFRAHQGEARLNQVRNNGLRALQEWGVLSEADLVVVLDGDTLLARHTIFRHRRDAAAGAQVIVPFRVNLDEGVTGRVAPEAVLLAAEGATGRDSLPTLLESVLTETVCAGLVERDARYRRQLALRKVAPFLIKSHKPKVLGGHHAVTVSCLRAVNGFDEEYKGYGFDDDDLTRRLYQIRPLPRIGVSVKESLAFHLWHPTRAPSRPTDAPGYARFSRKDLPMSAAHGWTAPLAQPRPVIREVSDGT